MASSEPEMFFSIPSGEPLAVRRDFLSDLAKFNGKPYADIRALLPKARAASSADDSNIAVIPIIGAISRYQSFWSRIFGSGSANVDDIQSQISDALADPTVQAILLEVDSPGGQVAGIADLADSIRAAAGIKPVVAFVSDLGASAAYWLSAAASKIVVSQSAFVGSIGVVATYVDTSKMDEAIGWQEIEIVSSQSPKKRPDPATGDGRTQIQSQIDALADLFVGAVADFRAASTENVLSSFGQGDIVLAQSAVSLGMADQVGTMADAISLANTLSSEKSGVAFAARQGEIHMTAEEKTYSSAEAQALVDKAKVEERGRIQGIYGLIRPEHMEADGAAIKAAMFDGKSSAGDVASIILLAQNARREAMQVARIADAAQIPTFNPEAQEKTKTSEENAAGAGIASYDPRKRGVKR
jgi:signal peptide peptidase SppA